MFEKLKDTDTQCVMALVVHITKRFTVSFFSKLGNSIVGCDNERASFTISSQINIAYGVLLATHFIGGRPATVVCMVAADALKQLIMTYQIVKLHKKNTVGENGISNKQKQKAILKLVLAELCEGLVPLAYALAFSMVYYGPNAGLLGYVKIVYWQKEKVQDESRTFLVMLGLFLLDTVCLAVNSSIIWILCKVNIWKEFCSVLKKYWYILVVKMVSDLYWNFYGQDVNFAGDTTGEFRWIENIKNISLT